MEYFCISMSHEIIYIVASTDADYGQGRLLFKAYVASLGVDLSFQDFEYELEEINIQYNKPGGALLLAMKQHAAIGCAGIRQLDAETAELKRMYVQDAYRGLGIGMRLLEDAIAIAREMGYKRMRLDTLQQMTKAQKLYSAFGFYEIPAYRFNPLAGTVYMEKVL